MSTTSDKVTTIDLDHDQIVVFDGGRDARIRVLHGSAWLTHEGACDDAIVPAGGELAVRAGRTVLAAIGVARVQWVERSGSRWARGAARLAGWARQARRQVTRWQLGPVGEPCGG
jgi:hypothetical protein